MDAPETVSESDTAFGRPPSIPLGRLGRGESESLSDRHLFFGRDEGSPTCPEATAQVCNSEDVGCSWVLQIYQQRTMDILGSTNLLRFRVGESKHTVSKGRFGVGLGGGVRCRSSSLSSELDENVSDGVGEMLRNLFGEGDAVSPSPYTSSAWDFMARKAVLRSSSRGFAGSSRTKARKAASVARERHPANRSRSRRVQPIRWRAFENQSLVDFEHSVRQVENLTWGRGYGL